VLEPGADTGPGVREWLDTIDTRRTADRGHRAPGDLAAAGYRVLRIPYRKWRRDPNLEVQRVLQAIRYQQVESNDTEASQSGAPAPQPDRGSKVQVASAQQAPRPPRPHALRGSTPPPRSTQYKVSAEQAAIVAGLRGGLRAEDDLLRSCRDTLGHRRMGPRIKEGLLQAAAQLRDKRLLVIEDGEYFLTPEGRTAEFQIVRPPPKRTARRGTAKRRTSSGRRHSSYRYRRY